MNGRMQSQSYLLRHADAIATATRLLELGTWHIADANYWRAWNRYHLKEYDAAWVDVENAIKGLSNSRVYMLAGLIAYARKDLPTAVERFDRAYRDRSQRLRRDVDVGAGQHRSERAGGGRRRNSRAA